MGKRFIRGAKCRSEGQQGRLDRFLEGLDLDEAALMHCPKTRAYFSIYFSSIEKAQIDSTASLFGIGIAQLSRVCVLHGIRPHADRIRWGRELGYGIR